MDRRNQLSIVIISLIIIGGSLAAPLTVRDHEIILDDFLNSPLFPSFNEEGILKLYYTSDYSEQNETLPLFEDYLLASNDSITVQRIWINITEILLLGKRAGNSAFFVSDDSFDVLDAYNDTLLLKSGNLTAAAYSGIQIFFDNTVLVQTETEFYEFELQSKSFVTLPFKMFGQENGNNVDLNIVENTINEVILDFNIDILWQNSTAMITTKALIL
jgi:hypothetical protein